MNPSASSPIHGRDIDNATLRRWDIDHVWHPFTAQADWAAAEPLIVDRAEGVYLYDRDGRRYLDGVSSLWCNVHGHRHPALDAAIRDQLDRVAHCTLLGVSHEPAIRLARRLVELAPPGLTRVFFSDCGATAVEVALKMAFQYWRQKDEPEPRRTRYLALAGAYHGDTLGDVSLGGVARFHSMFEPLLFPTLRAPIPYCYRCPLGKSRATCGIACLEDVERLLATHAGEVVAIVAESTVQAAAGMIVHPEGYLSGLAELARRHDTLLILDEVAVGFGRTGSLFACEQEAVAPDFLCVAKGLTGGYLPLAATLTTDRIHAAFVGDATDDRTFFHGHTYSGNPLGAAVALATLDVFDQEQTLERIRPRVEQLSAWLERLRDHPHVGDTRQRGLLAGIELVDDKSTKAPFDRLVRLGSRVCTRARDHGVVIRPLGDILVIMPPLVISESELAELLNAIEQSLHDVIEGLG